MRNRLLLTILLALTLRASANATVIWARYDGAATSTIWFDTYATSGGNLVPWNGGAQSGIVISANGHAIILNTDVTASRLSTAAESGGAAGGSWTMSSNCTVTANLLSGTTDCLTTSGTASLVVLGNIKGGTTGCNGLTINSSGPVTLGAVGAVVNIDGGTGGNGPYGVKNASTAAVTAYANVTGGTVTSAYGISNPSSGTITVINGVISGGTGQNAVGISNGGAPGTQILTLTSCDLVNTTTAAAVASYAGIVYNPGATNYIQYPKTAGTNNFYYDVPTAANTLTTDTTAGVTGTYNAITQNDARHKGSGYFGVTGSLVDGNVVVPGATYVDSSTTVDNGSGTAVSGTLTKADNNKVLTTQGAWGIGGNQYAGGAYIAVAQDHALHTGTAYAGVTGSLWDGGYYPPSAAYYEITHYFGVNNATQGTLTTPLERFVTRNKLYGAGGTEFRGKLAPAKSGGHQ